MALIYSIAGLVTGERGREFLHCAEVYLSHVKTRTEVSRNPSSSKGDSPSKDWCRLQIAVLNNQICIANELCLYGQLNERLEEMGERMTGASNLMDSKILREFALNLQCLLHTGDVAAAA